MHLRTGFTGGSLEHLQVSEPLAHALRALSHPVTWGSVVVLLVNDHILRWRWPGWLTGKLGDVAWLAFAPLVAAFGLAVIAELRQPDDGRAVDRVAVTAIALVGCVFAAVKALPGVTAAFHAVFRAVFGWTPRLVCDASDLLALPALGIAWMVWRRSSTALRRLRSEATGRGNYRPWAPGWGVVALALLATMGNSGPPEAGIECVATAETTLVAGPRYDYGRTSNFESADGGLTWAEMTQMTEGGADAACPVASGAWTLRLPDSDVVYRFVPGSRIERSVDGGRTWAVEFSLRGAEARAAYVERTRGGTTGSAGPHSAVFDPTTGNLVAAMGLEGVLVRKGAAVVASGDLWQWAPVGSYAFEPVTPVAAVTQVLALECWLAASVGLLVVAFWVWRMFPWYVRGVIAVWAVLCEVALLVLRPALMTGYATMVGWGATLALSAGSLVLAIVAVIWLWRRGAPGGWRSLLWAPGLGAIAALLFLTPLMFWAVGAMPRYSVAAFVAAAVAAVIWFLAAIRRGAKVSQPPK